MALPDICSAFLILCEVQKQHFNQSWEREKKCTGNSVSVSINGWSVNQSEHRVSDIFFQSLYMTKTLPLLRFLFQSVNVCFWYQARVSDNLKQYQVQQLLDLTLMSSEQKRFIKNRWRIQVCTWSRYVRISKLNGDYLPHISEEKLVYSYLVARWTLESAKCIAFGEVFLIIMLKEEKNRDQSKPIILWQRSR